MSGTHRKDLPLRLHRIPATAGVLASFLLVASLPAQDVGSEFEALPETFPWPGAAEDADRVFRTPDSMSRRVLRGVGRDAGKLAEAVIAAHEASPFSREVKDARIAEDLEALRTGYGAYAGTWFGQYARAAALPNSDAYENLAREARRATRAEDPFEDAALSPREAVAAAQRHWVEALGAEIEDATGRENWDVAAVLAGYQAEAQTLHDQGRAGAPFLNRLRDAYGDLRADHGADASLIQFGEGLELPGDAGTNFDAFRQGHQRNGAALDDFRAWINDGAPARNRGEPVTYQEPGGLDMEAPVFAETGPATEELAGPGLFGQGGGFAEAGMPATDV